MDVVSKAKIGCHLITQTITVTANAVQEKQQQHTTFQLLACNICSHQYVYFLLLELCNDFVPLALIHVSVKKKYVKLLQFQVVSKFLSIRLPTKRQKGECLFIDMSSYVGIRLGWRRISMVTSIYLQHCRQRCGNNLCTEQAA